MLITALAGCSGADAQSTQQLAQGQTRQITTAERSQGQQADKSILQEFGGAYQGPQAAYAARVGQKIAVQSGLSANPGAFDVTLLNSPVNNAFAIPGGYVYVTRELMALMNDEAELAAVLGHEVGHVAARHAAKRQSAATRNTVLGALGQLLVGQVVGEGVVGGLLNRGIGAGTQLATLGYSRGQETQSDDLGVAYLRRAGYDPGALSTMLASLAAQSALDARLAGQDARSVPSWASTHPDPGARVRHAADQAGRGTAGVRNRDAFLAAIDGMMYGEDPKAGVIDGRTFLHPGFRLAFTIPAGFTMQNGTAAVTISGRGGQAQFTTARYDGDLNAYVRTVVAGLGGGAGEVAVERTTVNGVPAAYSRLRGASGQTPIDVTIFAYAPPGSSAYHFVVITAAGQGLGAFQSMVQSFRPLGAADAAAVKPRYLRVVTVGPRDTVQSLSAQMAYPDARLERFTVLNGLRAGEPLRAGSKVKLVTH